MAFIIIFPAYIECSSPRPVNSGVRRFEHFSPANFEEERCNGISCATIEFQNCARSPFAVRSSRCPTRQEAQGRAKSFSASATDSVHLGREFPKDTVRVV